MSSFFLIKKMKLLIKIFFFSLGFFIGLIIFLLIKILYPFILIRFYNIISTRLGHFLDDMDIYLSCKKKNLTNTDLKSYRKSLDIFYFRSKISNKYVAKILKKKLIILPLEIMYWVDKFDTFTIKFLKFKRIHINGDSISGDSNHAPLLNRDIHGTYNFPRNFSFNRKEQTNGNLILKKLGIKSKYVCIYTRDSKYLKKNYPYNDWSKHNYRDTDINIMIDTCKFLIEKGFFVVRVGKDMEKKMSFKHEKFIDYSFSNFQSDFMDVFIIANCDFFISTSSGIDAIATAFRKEIIFPFLFPVMDTKSTTDRHFLAYRNLYSKKFKRNLTFSEIINYGYGYIVNQDDLIKNELELVDPSPTEIVEVVKDFLKTRTNYNFSDLDYIKFLEIFKTSEFYTKAGNQYHTKNHLNFKVSQYFLKQNHELWTR